MKNENYVLNDEPLLKVEKKLNKVEQKFEESTFALEMLQDKKRTIRYMFIIIVILIISLVGTNIGWLIYEGQFETVVEESTQTIDDIENPNNTTFTQTIN